MKQTKTQSTSFPRHSFALLATSLGTLAVGCFGAEEYQDVPQVGLSATEEGGGSGMSESGGGAPAVGVNPPPGQGMAGGAVDMPGAQNGGAATVDTGGAGSVPPAGNGGSAGGVAAGGGGGMGAVEPERPTFMCPERVSCVDGKAGEFDCSGVALLAHLSGPQMQGGTGNDIWGWTDPMTGKEYVLMGLTNGTAFLDISNPCQPIHLGHLKTETVNATWRDIKVYKDHAYIVAESAGHGIQVFDLTQLRNVQNPPVTFTANVVNNDIGATHNIVMNEESGFAYTVLANNCTSARMFDLSNPLAPVDAGCLPGNGRIHDAQCVNYKGPDPAFAGKEVCFSGNESAGVAVYDVTDKAAAKQVGATRYMNVNYGHQGWLTEDHRYFLFGDEADEISASINTTIYIFDVTNVANPTLKGTFVGDLPATDHNLYVRGQYAFLASYAAGLRILDLSQIDDGVITEAGYFDTYPMHNSPGFNEMWSNYPYFKSGVVVTSGGEGLFILHPEAKFTQ